MTEIEADDEKKQEDMKITHMFDIENLSIREKTALFGEPTKLAKDILMKKNPLMKGADKIDFEIIKKVANFDQVSLEFGLPDYVKKELKLSFSEKFKNFFQKLVISTNNPYKSVWDFFLLILITYNCMIICY